MGSAVGALKVAAARVGLSAEEYQARVAGGEKWCTGGKHWRPRAAFATDRSRGDGLVAQCFDCRRTGKRRQRVNLSPTAQVRNAASNAVRTAIRRGELPPATEQACADCGDPAQQYHHDRGYDREHWLSVVALCRSCHVRRHWEAA